VWTTNSLDGTISRINPQTNKVTAVQQVGSGPDAIAAGAGGVWVANEFGGTVVRVDPATNAPARPITVGNSPRGLAVAGGLVWVSAQASLTTVPTSGPGLTQPTSPSGTKVSGGTVYFTEGPDSTPNYIFPMYSSTNCTTTNVNQFMDMLYRPLYWYGNNYRPTVAYGYSIGQRPQFSDGDKTVTIKLNPWKWSDGETVTSRDLMFWMNVLKADPATEWCGYAPGLFPDLVTSYSAPDPQTFVMHFNKAYNPECVLYNVLSQLTPLPLAWDRTSLSQPAPTSDNGHLFDSTRVGAAAIYKFLDGEAKKFGGWTSSPLWKVVDGPFKLQSFTSTGEVTLVPNPSYSGSPKPTISKLVELPYASDAASYIAVRSGGPSAVTIANIPSQYAPAIPTLTAEGYELNRAAAYAFNYFPLNFNSSATTSPGGEPVRYVVRQAYFRRAFQHLVDQQGWITAFFLGSANPTCGPIPLAPPSPLVNAAAVSARPCAFSVAAARQLLTANGWNVVPGGQTTCVKPGTGPGACGAEIKAGEGILFNVDYQSGVVSVHDEMKDLAAQARRVGINLSLTAHPFDTVVGAAVPCTPEQATCKWQAENWGAGWVYGPAYLPTGEQLYYPGAVGNAGSYTDPKMTQLIQATVAGPAASDATALTEYEKYAEQQLPVVFGPTQIGTYSETAGTLVAKNLGGYAANALGLMNPEDWYFTR
jgi:peptide/nickel transport system substrate-binding protein